MCNVGGLKLLLRFLLGYGILPFCIALVLLELLICWVDFMVVRLIILILCAYCVLFDEKKFFNSIVFLCMFRWLLCIIVILNTCLVLTNMLRAFIRPPRGLVRHIRLRGAP